MRSILNLPAQALVDRDPLLRVAMVLAWLLPASWILGRGALDTTLSAVALLFLIHSGLKGGWGWIRRPWTLVAAAISAYFVLQLPFVADPQEAAWRAIPWFRFWVFAAALQHWVMADGVQRKAALVAMGVTVVLVAADVWLQFFLGADILGQVPEVEGRLTGPLPDYVVAPFLVHLSMPFLAAAIAWAAARRSASSSAMGAAIGAAVIALALATALIMGSRSPFFLLAVGILFIVIVTRSAWRLAVVWAAVAAVALGALLVVDRESTDRMVLRTSQQVAEFSETPWGQVVRAGVAVWRDNPIFGVGMRNFRMACEDPRYDDIGPVRKRCQLHPHNTYIEWLAEGGVIGLALFLAFLAAAAWEARGAFRLAGTERAFAVGALAMAVTILFPVSLTSSFFSNDNACLIWLCIGWALAFGAVRTPGQR